MSAAYVKELGKQAAGGATANLTVTLSATAASTSLVIVRAVCGGGQNVSSVTDSRSNTWTVDKVGSTGPKCALCSTGQDVAALQSGDTVVVHFTGSAGQSAAIVDEFSGCDQSGTRVDQTATGTASGTSRNAGTTATTTQANELVVGVFAGGTAETGAYTSGAGYSDFTTKFLVDTATTIEGEFQAVSATGAYNPTATGASFATNGAVVTYKAAAGGASLTQNVDDTVTMSDATAFQFSVTPADSVTMSDTVAFQRSVTVADSVTAADTGAVAFDFTENLADSVVLSDGVTTAAGKGASIADSVTMADTLAFQRSVTVTDTVTMTDTLALARQILLGDSVAMTDGVVTILPSGAPPPTTIRTYATGNNGATRAVGIWEATT